MKNQIISITRKRVPTAPVLVGLWFAIALVISASGLLYGVPAPVLGATNAMIIASSLLAIYFIEPIRNWVMNLDLRVFVFYHVVRFVGIAFLVFHAQGIIPSEFAIIAGWGDIAVATTAILVAGFALPVTTPLRWKIVLLWNLLGLVDILYVLRTGIGLGLSSPEKMLWITSFPFSLLPIFIVPLIIITHILVFIRLRELRLRLKNS